MPIRPHAIANGFDACYYIKNTWHSAFQLQNKICTEKGNPIFYTIQLAVLTDAAPTPWEPSGDGYRNRLTDENRERVTKWML